MFQPLPTASMSVGLLFADPQHFTIPAYQRPYSWTVEAASQLLEDVSNAAGIDDAVTFEDDYFLGTILLLDAHGGPRAATSQAGPVRELEIVDGQQRLVTLTILGAVLRDLDVAASGALLSDVANRLDALVRPAAGGDRPASRIGLSGESHTFLVDHVLSPGACLRAVPDLGGLGFGHRAIIDARDRFVRDLADFSNEQRAALAAYVCERCHFVVVTTSDIDRAHRIFMILNDRGQRLQKKDILKAEILRAVEPARLSAAIATWATVEQDLGDEMEAFFSHLRAAYGHNRQQVIAGVRSVVREAGGADAFMTGVFEPLAQAFRTILAAGRPDTQIAEPLRRPLAGLARLNGSEWVPAALIVLSRCANDPETASFYLFELERAAFLMRLVCLGSGKRQTRFSKIAATLSAPELPEPGAIYEPTREEIRTASYNLRDLHTRNVQACKALLLRLNDERQPAAVFADPASYTVEHVLPQRPKATSQWREWFPDTEERMALTASLGNLVLISHGLNDRARNEDYATKKAVYALQKPGHLQLAITSELLASDAWRGEQIRRREAKFVTQLYKMWRLELDGQPVDETAS